MKKALLVLLVNFTFYNSYSQPIGILKSKDEIIKEWKFLESDKTKYHNTINANKLNVLLIEEGARDYRYVFNAKGICFQSNINFHFPKEYQLELPIYIDSFERYFLGQYTKYQIVEVIVTKDLEDIRPRIEKEWVFHTNNYSCTIVRQIYNDNSTNYFCTGIFLSNP